jgi:hypothetical protein
MLEFCRGSCQLPGSKLESAALLAAPKAREGGSMPFQGAAVFNRRIIWVGALESAAPCSSNIWEPTARVPPRQNSALHVFEVWNFSGGWLLEFGASLN